MPSSVDEISQSYNELIEKAKSDQNSERRIIALQLAARNFFKQRMQGDDVNATFGVFSRLFDDMIRGIIEQNKRTVSLDLVLDRKGGKNSENKG